MDFTAECSYKLNDIFDIKKLLIDENYRKESNILVSQQGVLYVLKYDRKMLNENNLNTLGLFRSVIVNEEGKILCFAPPKSIICDTENLFSENNVSDISVEEIVEGSMINLFWYDTINDWELATRSQIGAKSKYNYESKNSFRYMFLETMNEMNLDFNDFDKNFCYSFILQHPDNKRICSIKEKKLYLTNIYTISNNNLNQEITPVPRKMMYEKLNLIIKSPSSDNILLPQLCNFTNNEGVVEFDKKIFDNILKSYHDFNFVGYMINLPLKRIKYTNPEYQKIKFLKGNSPRLQYTYYELRKKGKVKEYLRYFPENANLFNTFRKDIHNYTRNLYNCYKSCYIKKNKPVKEFPYQYKTHMYHLHQLYLENYKDNNDYINLQKVIDYVNNLESPRLLYVVNYVSSD